MFLLSTCNLKNINSYQTASKRTREERVIILYVNFILILNSQPTTTKIHGLLNQGLSKNFTIDVNLILRGVELESNRFFSANYKFETNNLFQSLR